MTGTTHKFIDTPWVYTHTPTQKADISSVIVSAGKGQQENLDRESEIRTWGGAGNDGGAELLASQAPQEEDDDDQAKVEDEEESATVEWESEGEPEEDEEASDTEEGESEGEHEGVGADGDAELPVSQASQEEDDDDPDKVEDDEASAEGHRGRSLGGGQREALLIRSRQGSLRLG